MNQNNGKTNQDSRYATTNSTEYVSYGPDMYAKATRPETSNGFKRNFKLADPIGETTGRTDFSWKTAKPMEPILSGTSSGNRRNNPHPNEEFMIWRLSKKGASAMISPPAKYLGYRKLDEKMMTTILADQGKSTYQSDFLGSEDQGPDAPPNCRNAIPRPADTTFRNTYGVPEEVQEIAGNTVRYGCNKLKNQPAHGSVPTVTNHQIRMQTKFKSKSSYQSDFV